MAREEIVMPLDFMKAMEAAGFIHDLDRITEVNIRIRPKEVVHVEVTYVADKRIYGLLGMEDRHG